MKRLALLAALLAAAIAVPLGIGSSHREAPNIMLDPTADNTDVYAYTAKDAPDSLTVVANWIPGEVPGNGPNFFRFDDRAHYYISIDNTGDGKADIRYQFDFKTKVKNKNSFLYALPGVKELKDLNVLQVPEKAVTKNHKAVASAAAKNAVVGVWSTTERRKLQVTDKAKGGNGGFVQVSRLGNPLVNEVVIPLGKKDQFNRTKPNRDAALYGKYVVKPELAAVLNALFKVNAPENNRTDIVQALLQGIPKLNQLAPGKNPLPTDTLKLNLGVPPAADPNRFGVLAGDNAGFPNGRRLEDDVVDIELQVFAGFLKGNKVPLGDGVDKNDKEFLSFFPYLPNPVSGFDSAPSTRIEPEHSPTPAGGK